MNKCKFTAVSTVVLLFLGLLISSFQVNAIENCSCYVIVVAPQEYVEWKPVIDKLKLYHPGAVTLVLPSDIQNAVMNLERHVRYLTMDGLLKMYLWLMYYVWGGRSIPVPMGYYKAGWEELINSILFLDRHKAEVHGLFYNWFQTELGHQPHYIATIGDIKTRRSDWLKALGMATWWNTSLKYPADAWPMSINCSQVPVAYLPIEVDECLAWYGYAVGRITGLTVDDAVALVKRAADYNEWALTNINIAKKFLGTFTVGVRDYYSQLPDLINSAGYELAWYSPDGPDYPTWTNAKAVLEEGVGFWDWYCHGNFMTPTEGPGNGIGSFLVEGKEDTYYDIPVGNETPKGGWSGNIWDFINTGSLSAPIQSCFIDRVPSLDHTIVSVTACLVGSSELPLQFIEKGAVAVRIGITPQEGCEGGCNAAYFIDALTHTNPDTGNQFSIGEAMAYANINTHVLHYYYAVSGGMTYWCTMYLIGDPALVPYVPNVSSEPPIALDTRGNNPGAYSGGSQQVGNVIVPIAFESPDGSVAPLRTGQNN